MSKKTNKGKKADPKTKSMSSRMKNGSQINPGNEKGRNESSLRSSKSNVSPAKPVDKKTNTPIYLRFVYAFMLLLMLAGGAARIAGKKSQSSGAAEPTQVQPQGSSQAASAKELAFHREGGIAEVCDDLTVTAEGDAVLAACNGGGQHQYHLNSSEQQQLNTWLDEYKSFNYDSGQRKTAADMVTSLFLNGRGNNIAGEVELNKVMNFAVMLDSEIESQQ